MRRLALIIGATVLALSACGSSEKSANDLGADAAADLITLWQTTAPDLQRQLCAAPPLKREAFLLTKWNIHRDEWPDHAAPTSLMIERFGELACADLANQS